jgi:hypothetical protein
MWGSAASHTLPASWRAFVTRVDFHVLRCSKRGGTLPTLCHFLVMVVEEKNNVNLVAYLAAFISSTEATTAATQSQRRRASRSANIRQPPTPSCEFPGRANP